MTGHCGERMLPDHPHLGHLRRQAKARLAAMQVENPQAQLAQAQFHLARDYGFASWRALVAEAMRRRTQFMQSRQAIPPRPHAPAWRQKLALEAETEPGRNFFGAATVLHVGLVFALLAGMSTLLPVAHSSRASQSANGIVVIDPP